MDQAIVNNENAFAMLVSSVSSVIALVTTLVFPFIAPWKQRL
jgi:hypothetical protein